MSSKFRDIIIETVGSTGETRLTLKKGTKNIYFGVDNTGAFRVYNNNSVLFGFSDRGVLLNSDLRTLILQMQNQINLLSNRVSNLETYNNRLRSFINAFSESVYIDDNGGEFNYNGLK